MLRRKVMVGFLWLQSRAWLRSGWKRKSWRFQACPIWQPKQSLVASEKNGLVWKSVIQHNRSLSTHIICNLLWERCRAVVMWELLLVYGLLAFKFLPDRKMLWFSRGVVRWICWMLFLLVCQSSKQSWGMQPAVIHLLQIRTMRSGCSLKKQGSVSF